MSTNERCDACQHHCRDSIHNHCTQNHFHQHQRLQQLHSFKAVLNVHMCFASFLTNRSTFDSSLSLSGMNKIVIDCVYMLFTECRKHSTLTLNEHIMENNYKFITANNTTNSGYSNTEQSQLQSACFSMQCCSPKKNKTFNDLCSRNFYTQAQKLRRTAPAPQVLCLGGQTLLLLQVFTTK